MSKIAGNSAAVVDRAFTLLAPDEVLIFDHDQGLLLSYPVKECDSNLFEFAKKLSELPNPSWLHLATIDNQPVFVLSCSIDKNQIAFLTYPSTTRISQLEEKLVLLQNSLSNQTPDPLTAILQDLTTSDLKTGTVHQSKQDDFLSIFTDLERSAIKTYPTPPNLGDTQPISI